MTLPAEYTYVTQFISEHRTDLDTFRKKLVELIIGSNTDQTNQLMLTQRNANEHILTFFNRLQMLYLYCAGKSDASKLEEDAWGMRLIYQKVIGAMNEAARLELQRLVEDKIESGALKYSELKGAVVRAARKCKVPQPSDYIAVQSIDQFQPSTFHDNSNTTMNALNDRRNQSRNSNGARNEFQQHRNNHTSNTYHRDQSFNEMNAIRCFYCGQTGHKKDNATENKMRNVTDITTSSIIEEVTM